MTAGPITSTAIRAAYGWGGERDWDRARQLIDEAAAAGEPDAERQRDLVGQLPLDRLLAPPEPQRLHAEARIAAVPGFAPPGFAEWLIDRASGRLEKGTLGGAMEQRFAAARTARTCFFPPRECDLVLAVLQERARALVGVPIPYHEPPSVISYEPGQRFAPHVDFVDPDIPDNADELRLSGQRTATIVTYLNDEFEGAPTIFPKLDLTLRGRPGDAFFWANVLPDGSPDRRTVHRAPPPASGRKWVLSQWFRAKPFPFSPEQLPR